MWGACPWAEPEERDQVRTPHSRLQQQELCTVPGSEGERPVHCGPHILDLVTSASPPGPRPKPVHEEGVGMLRHSSHVRLFVTPWTAACQAPLSMGFSTQEY